MRNPKQAMGLRHLEKPDGDLAHLVGSELVRDLDQVVLVKRGHLAADGDRWRLLAEQGKSGSRVTAWARREAHADHRRKGLVPAVLAHDDEAFVLLQPQVDPPHLAPAGLAGHYASR